MTYPMQPSLLLAVVLAISACADDATVSFQITYATKQSVFSALTAAHAVLNQAEAVAQSEQQQVVIKPEPPAQNHPGTVATNAAPVAIKMEPSAPCDRTSSSDAKAWQVLRDPQRCFDTALRFKGWPSNGFAEVHKRIWHVPNSTATPAVVIIAALRDQLRLTRAQWDKLGHVEILPLPASAPGLAGDATGSVSCSYGDALKVLQVQHAWVSTAGLDPKCWAGNRWAMLPANATVPWPGCGGLPQPLG